MHREKRQGIDLVHDGVEKSLIKVNILWKYLVLLYNIRGSGSIRGRYFKIFLLSPV
jgi:hypothetical protein